LDFSSGLASVGWTSGGADLTSASLVDASLRGVVLTGANLTGAYLARADLTGAKLIDAHLTMADFCSAKLIKANLCGADLSRADLNDADLRMPPWPWLEFFSMRFSRALGFMLLLFALPPLHAQAPVVPSADPESLFTSSNPRLNANKQVVLHIIRDLLEANHWEDANKYLTERYIQHNPYVASGLAPVRKFFNAKEATPIPRKMKTPVVAVTADGEAFNDAVADLGSGLPEVRANRNLK
jgi:hypothetical protein